MSADNFELTIEAGHAEHHYWRDVWRYRDLLALLAWRDIKVRYKQAALGVGWAVIQPVVQTLLLTFVFSNLARMPSGGVPYFLLVLCGNLPWQLFSSAFNGAGNSLVGSAHLISKTYFPRLIVPMSALVIAFVDFLVVLVISIPVLWSFGFWPTWHLLLLPAFVLLALLLALGAGLWAAALMVRFRDFRFIIPFLLQIGVFVTPVGFRTDNLPNWRNVLDMNPLTAIVDGMRWCLLGGATELRRDALVVALLACALLLITGLWYFRKTERQFADIV